MIEYKSIEVSSIAYFQSLGLRYAVLRKPLELHFNPSDFIHDFEHFHIGAFEGQQLVAILILSPINSGWVKMRQVAVDQAHQSRKLGTGLVEFAEKFIRDEGFTGIELNARKTAVTFYKKMNYEICGNEFEEVGIPHYKMMKNLSS